MGLKTLCATVFLFEIGHFCWKAKTCPKHRAQHSCCSKLASIHSAQLWIRLKLASFVNKQELVKNTVRYCPVAEKYSAQLSCCSKLASEKSAQLSFCLKLVIFVKNLNLVQNTLHNCPVAGKWRHDCCERCFRQVLASLKQSQTSRKTTVVQSVLTPISSNTTVAHRVLDKF